MTSDKTVSINGRTYDAITGLPVAAPAHKAPQKKAAPSRAATPKVAASTVTLKKQITPTTKKTATPRISRGTTTSEIVHGSTVQRSQTLRRRATKKPEVKPRVIKARPTPGRHMDIARSTNVSKFAKHPVIEQPVTAKTTSTKEVAVPAAKPVAKPTTKPVAKPAVKPVAKKLARTNTNEKPDRAPTHHPVAARALQRSQKKTPVIAAAPTTKQVKDAAIDRALKTPKVPAQKTRKRTLIKNAVFRRSVIISAIAIVIIALAITIYRVVPSISVSIAAAQAGISASYPEYTPDGYSLSHPVTYSDGEVSLKFASHSNDNYYTITQTRSSWDSSAVLDNIVTPAADANYITTKERGLTIYSYDAHATWVNGGILYQIASKAPLSGDQIRKIATSL